MMMITRVVRKAAALAAVCILVASATLANAAVVPASADTRLSNDANRGPTSNESSSNLFDVRWFDNNAGTQRVRIGYVRFDITGIDPSQYSRIFLSGNFHTTSHNGPPEGSTINVWGLNDDVVAGRTTLGNDWDESLITYSNAGGVDNSAPLGSFAFTSDSTLLGTLSFDGSDVEPLAFRSNPAELDLTAFLNDDTDGLVTFMFMDDAVDNHEYRIDAKDGTLAPGHGPMMLHFVPEPTSICLTLMGMVGVAGLWSRRRS